VPRTLLIRGTLVGLVAGLMAFLVAKLLGEHSLTAGIAFESAAAAARGEAAEPAMVSRTVQSTAGLAVASLTYGVALGGLFALVYSVAQGRLGRLSVRATAASVAAGGFLALYLLPALKYPANPPGASDASTIGDRTYLYFLMLTASVLIVVGVVLLARQWTARLGAWNAAITALVVGVAALAVMGVVLPGVHETPAGFPAATLWQFRISSAATQLAAWATIGLLFGALTERALQAREPDPATVEPATVPVLGRR